METNKIYQGDCLELMKQIDDKSIDLILCDLPYGTTQNKWDCIIPLDLLWKEYWRIIKERGSIVLTAQPPFDKQLGASCLKYMQYEWIWKKTRATGHLNAKKQPMRAHENILVFYKKSPIYNPQNLIKKVVPTIRKGTDNGTNYGLSDKDAVQEFENYPNSILEFSSERNGFHPTQKPVALFEYLIKTYTNKGDLVLDNCIGSGTTAIACVNTKRNFIGMELSEEYVEIANERIQKELSQSKLKVMEVKQEAMQSEARYSSQA